MIVFGYNPGRRTHCHWHPIMMGRLLATGTGTTRDPTEPSASGAMIASKVPPGSGSGHSVAGRVPSCNRDGPGTNAGHGTSAS